MDKEWQRFIESGSVKDYLNYVNSCKENGISDRITNTVHDRGIGNKGNECRGE